MAHVGTRTMEQIHKHTNGVPKLHRNAFYRWPSCMPGKLCTKLPGYHQTIGITQPVQLHIFPEHVNNNELNNLLDDVYLPDTPLG